MAEKDILQLLGEQSGATQLPIVLPDEYSDAILKPSLAPVGRELEEYRVRVAAQQMGVDPDIAAAVAFQESRFDPNAVSKTGVKGTMQVTSNTAKGLGYNRDIPDENIRAGIALLKQGMDKHPDNINKALRVYPAPKDRNHWIPSVIGHSIKSKEARENQMATIEDITADIPDDMFSIPEEPSQNTLSNAPESSTSNDQGLLDTIISRLTAVNPLAQAMPGQETTPEAQLNRNLATIQGILKGSGGEFLGRMAGKAVQPITDPIVNAVASLAGSEQTAESSRKGMEERLAQAESEAIPQDIIGRILGTLTPGGPLARTAQVAGKAAAIPKVGKLIAPSIIGATGAAEYSAMQPEATPEGVVTAGAIGAVIPPVLKGVAKGMKVLGNKLGDIVLKKTDIGGWINKTFGPTKSIRSLQAKNNVKYQQVEKQLQDTLEQADNQLGQLHIDKSKLAPKIVKVGKEPIEQNVLHRAAEDVLSNEGSQEAADLLTYLGDKVARNEPFTRVELNVMKRALYTYGNSWTKAGNIKSNEFAKNVAKMGNYLKTTIEDNTGEAVKALNQEEQMHMLLRDAIYSKMSKKPSAWSLFSKLLPAVSLGGGAGAAGGPVTGALTTGAALAGQTVPGFTSVGAAGQALDNPELSRILSTLLPQYLKGE